MPSVQIKNRQQAKLQLMKDLENFGLNPFEWEINGQRGGLFTIRSKKDRDFILLGTIRRIKQSVCWQNITLAGL